MSPQTIATILWSLLGLAVVISMVGLTIRSWWLMMIAANMTFVFAIAAMFSIGIFLMPIAILQAVAAVSFRRKDLRRPTNTEEV